MNILRIFAILIYILNSFSLLSQREMTEFKRLSIEQGLSQSFVPCLLKDSQGFVWAGTQNGLNRFDGYEFDGFYNEKNDSTSLSNNYILEVFESDNGLIWIGTFGGGLCAFDPKLNAFQTFLPTNNPDLESKSNIIRCIQAMNHNKLLVGTDGGLLAFSTETHRFDQLKSSSDNENSAIYSVADLHPDYFIIGGLEKIYLLNKNSLKLVELGLDQNVHAGIHSLLIQSLDRIWAGTGKGLYLFELDISNLHLNTAAHYVYQPGETKSISSNSVASLAMDDHEILWIGTNDGLNYLDTNKPENGFFHFKNDANEVTSISNNFIYDIEKVEKGKMWVATQQGINQFSYEENQFSKISLTTQNGACGNSLHGLVENGDGAWYACSDQGLLVLKNPTNALIDVICLSKKDFPNMADEFLVNIHKGKSDKYWVALRRGGYAMFSKQGDQYKWKGYQLPAGAYATIGTNDFVEDGDNILWIASSGLGLWSYNLSTQAYSSYTSNAEDSLSISGNYIFSLTEDHQDNLLVATADGGFCKMDKKNQSFTCFTNNPDDPASLSSNMVLSVFEDSQHRVWACTADGLNLLQEEQTFLRFYKKDGLPNNVVYGMLEDEQGNLWISTDRGLSKISYDSEGFECRNFRQNDGLIRNEFNQHSYLKTTQGQLVFGAKGGLTLFDPEKVKKYEVKPKLVFKSFNLFNEPVGVTKKENESTVLIQSINFTEKIHLPYNKNFLSFEFSGINFEQGEDNVYAFKMDGLDPDWQQNGTRRFANYPGLKPGEYTFMLKSANHDGIWNKQPRTIGISISPPPWMTWWAYTLYILLGVAAIYSFFNYRIYTIRQIEKTKQNERTEFRKRSARDFHDEAGNQITRISLMTEVAKRKLDTQSEVIGLLDQIGDNVQTLRSSMKDFIWVLDPDNDNLYETLLRLKTFANGIFEFSEIRFSTRGIEETLSSFSLNSNARRHLLMVFKEAMNNTLKHSNASHAIFEVVEMEKQLILKFTDDGRGFDSSTPQNGYGLTNMKNRIDKMGANMEISSSKEEGTSIQVIFNTTQMDN